MAEPKQSGVTGASHRAHSETPPILVVVSRPAPPALTIRHNGSQVSFEAGYEVVIGRDLHADLRIPDPRISRAHLILRFDQGRWLAIDNGSLNGTYVNGYRMPVVDIHDGQSIHVGNPAGPRLTFQIGPQRGQASRPPHAVKARSMHDSGPPTLAWSVTPPPHRHRHRHSARTWSPARSRNRPRRRRGAATATRTRSTKVMPPEQATSVNVRHRRPSSPWSTPSRPMSPIWRPDL
ncbi:FHA domain-containing protein [Mycobacterium kubicae]|nr:FHA domain-containing protein [Mycobacterium kubicae]